MAILATGTGTPDTHAQSEDRLKELLSRFAGRDEGFVEELLANAQLVRLARGEFAFRSGDRCTAYFILVDGSVRVQLLSTEGREITLYHVRPGGTCVLTTSCLLGHQDYPAEAIAETEVEAIAIPSELFESALERVSAFRKQVFRGFSGRLTNMIDRISDLAFTPVDVRLAIALLGMHRDGKEKITHQELAVELGTAREVVSRHLKRFESKGWLRLARGRIKVTDPEGLESVRQAGMCD